MSSLEQDMHNSKVILNLITNDNFAQELYAALCNIDWFKRENDIEGWGCSWRTAGAIVAELRNRIGNNPKECYLNWYCSGSEGNVSDQIEEALSNLGWTKYKKL